MVLVLVSLEPLVLWLLMLGAWMTSRRRWPLLMPLRLLLRRLRFLELLLQ